MTTFQNMKGPKRVIVTFSGIPLHMMYSHARTVMNTFEQDTRVKVAASGDPNTRKPETVFDAQRLMKSKVDHGIHSCVKDNSKSYKVKVPIAGDSKKRKPETMLDSPQPKIRKMDRGVKLKCGHILKELLVHPFSLEFDKPVDPIALNIPNYLDIISDPMDLGTIKLKLESNEYSCAEEFASDVNLTFSNAMMYNSPSHDVNKMAKFLDSTFRSRWKLVVRKWNNESTKYCEKPSSNAATEVKNSMTLEEKKRLWQATISMIDAKLPEKLRSSLKNSKLIGLIEGNIKLNMNDLDDISWLELRSLLKSIYVDVVVPEKTENTGRCFLTAEATRKGALGSSKCCSCGNITCHCANLHTSTLVSPKNKSFRSQHLAPTDAVKKDLSNRATASNQRKTDLPTKETGSYLNAVKKDLTTYAPSSCSKKAAKKDLRTYATRSGSNVVRKDRPINSTSLGSKAMRKDLPTNATSFSGLNAIRKGLPTLSRSNSKVVKNYLHTYETNSKSNASKRDLPTTSGQDFLGFDSVKDEAKTSTISEISPPLSTTATPGGEGYAFPENNRYSPERAQRVAMLKNRFAETIRRSYEYIGPKRLEEKERLERKQREEEAKIKAIIKEQRSKARQDARTAIEIMERTTNVKDNLTSLKELESLCGCPPTHCLYTNTFRKRVEKIGLFLKKNEFLNDDDDDLETEEGEIKI